MSELGAESEIAETARADVGLVCALAMELNPFFERCERPRTISAGGFRFRGGRLENIRIAAVESGAGMRRAEKATRGLIEGHRPRWILAVGFAGGLIDGLGVGDVLVADSVVRERAEEDEEIAISHGMPPDPNKGLHVGRLVTCESIVRTVARKRSLGGEYGAVACDMESHAVARVCQEQGLRFMAVRGITDDTSADLPMEIHALLSATGARRAGATVSALWNRPESAKDLWKLRQAAGRASNRLAPFLESVVKQLAGAE